MDCPYSYMSLGKGTRMAEIPREPDSFANLPRMGTVVISRQRSAVCFTGHTVEVGEEFDTLLTPTMFTLIHCNGQRRPTQSWPASNDIGGPATVFATTCDCQAGHARMYALGIPAVFTPNRAYLL